MTTCTYVLRPWEHVCNGASWAHRVVCLCFCLRKEGARALGSQAISRRWIGWVTAKIETADRACGVKRSKRNAQLERRLRSLGRVRRRLARQTHHRSAHAFQVSCVVAGNHGRSATRNGTVCVDPHLITFCMAVWPVGAPGREEGWEGERRGGGDEVVPIQMPPREVGSPSLPRVEVEGVELFECRGGSRCRWMGLGCQQQAVKERNGGTRRNSISSCNHALNSTHFWSIRCVFYLIFESSRVHCFTPKKKPKLRKRAHFRNPCFASGPERLKGGHFDSKGGQKREPIPGWG